VKGGRPSWTTSPGTWSGSTPEAVGGLPSLLRRAIVYSGSTTRVGTSRELLLVPSPI
jgi:hypothetical protein